ncbi:MAG: DUF4166 domain-containing protein [Sneathiellales bacterium]|nr:DUF4166 domain-containing protein [Sneathiellales bacterium]
MTPEGGSVQFVYDGDCPLCRAAARAFRIKKAAGSLEVVDAREGASHPLVREVIEAGLNLDEGMVVKYGGRLYHGADALQIMALIGSSQGWFNQLNAFLFKIPVIAKISYPVMRAGRNLLLRLLGVNKLDFEKAVVDGPLFKQVFGSDWPELPEVMHKHYAAEVFTDDIQQVHGTLDIFMKPWIKGLAKLTGQLVRQSGENVPVTVSFSCKGSANSFFFDRKFSFPDGDTQHFRSRMVWQGDNVLIEFMRFGLGWKLAYSWEEGKVILRHKGYVWRLLGFNIPVPLSLLMGKGYAEETPLDDNSFQMKTYTEHFLFGKIFGYSGRFDIGDKK